VIVCPQANPCELGYIASEREARFTAQELSLGNKITLRSLFFVTALTAIILMVLRMALQTQGDNATAAIAVVILVPVVTFGLFGIAFLFLLPFGVIAALSRESSLPGTSPFAEDQLPQRHVEVVDPERAN
jgi:hypothetical protein